MMKNRVKTTAKKFAISLSLALAGMVAAPQPAMAYESDPFFNAWVNTYYSAFVSEVDNQFFAINTYMAEIYAYLNSGEGEKGTGLIATINKLAQVQRPYEEALGDKQSAWGRRNMMDGVNAQAIMNNMPNPRNCSELAANLGARAAGGGGGAGGGSLAAKGKVEAEVAKAAGGGKKNDIAHADDIYKDHKSKGYCSAQDASYPDGKPREAFGCTPADVKKMPSGGSRVQSILRPAHDFNDPAAVVQYGRSLTYNNGEATSSIGDQRQAAIDSIKTMVASFSPPYLPKEVEQTESGKLLLAKVDVFNARVSPAIDALSTAESRLDSGKNFLNKNDGAIQAGLAFLGRVLEIGEFSDTYKRLYPGSPVPVFLSEAEVARFEVMRRYADVESGWNKDLAKTGSATDIAKIQAQNEAVQIYLLYNMHERQLETNALLSSLVAQSVNPVTRAELERGVQSAQRPSK